MVREVNSYSFHKTEMDTLVSAPSWADVELRLDCSLGRCRKGSGRRAEPETLVVASGP